MRSWARSTTRQLETSTQRTSSADLRAITEPAAGEGRGTGSACARQGAKKRRRGKQCSPFFFPAFSVTPVILNPVNLEGKMSEPQFWADVFYSSKCNKEETNKGSGEWKPG